MILREKTIKSGKNNYKVWCDDRTGWHCDCMHGTIHFDAWREGKELCKHIISAIKLVREETNGKASRN